MLRANISGFFDAVNNSLAVKEPGLFYDSSESNRENIDQLAANLPQLLKAQQSSIGEELRKGDSLNINKVSGAVNRITTALKAIDNHSSTTHAHPASTQEHTNRVVSSTQLPMHYIGTVNRAAGNPASGALTIGIIRVPTCFS
ncbi:MAG: hypothetical protein EBZ48_07655 [Proteobacteria bacterium]|nr:hypothetical protein [Pseudomonadota bacterium]